MFGFLVRWVKLIVCDCEVLLMKLKVLIVFSGRWVSMSRLVSDLVYCVVKWVWWVIGLFMRSWGRRGGWSGGYFVRMV